MFRVYPPRSGPDPNLPGSPPKTPPEDPGPLPFNGCVVDAGGRDSPTHEAFPSDPDRTPLWLSRWTGRETSGPFPPQGSQCAA